MNKALAYMIRKDGLWLIGYQASGIKEYLGDGRLVNVPTCIYGDRRDDAMTFDEEYKARNLAQLLGADLMVIDNRYGVWKGKRAWKSS